MHVPQDDEGLSSSSTPVPSRWHSEPGYSWLMDCIRAVRLRGESSNVVCERLKISQCVLR